MRRKGLMRADYGRKSWASVENPYTPVAPKINHGCRKVVMVTRGAENGMIRGAG
jgi:LSD1 subclass zinc finger protein